MKKTILIGAFILITALSYGDENTAINDDNNINKEAILTGNTITNKEILESLKKQNEMLKTELEKLKERLNDWRSGSINYTDIEDQGVTILREKNKLTLSIEEEKIDNDKYTEILMEMSKIMKYDVNTKVYITGNQYNIDYLKELFQSQGNKNIEYSISQVSQSPVEDKADNTTDLDKNEEKINDQTNITKIIFQKLEVQDK